MIRFLYRRFVIDRGNFLVRSRVYVSYPITFRVFFYLYRVHKFDIAGLQEAHPHFLVAHWRDRE